MLPSHLFDDLPDSAFLRESQLVQDPKRPDYPALLPFSSATLWRKVSAGTFPKPVKLSKRVQHGECRRSGNFFKHPLRV